MMFQVQYTLAVIAALLVFGSLATFMQERPEMDENIARMRELQSEVESHGWDDDIVRPSYNKRTWIPSYRDGDTDDYSGDSRGGTPKTRSLFQSDELVGTEQVRARTELARKEYIIAREAESFARDQAYLAESRFEQAIEKERMVIGGLGKDREDWLASKHHDSDEEATEHLNGDFGSESSAKGLLQDSSETNNKAQTNESGEVEKTEAKSDASEDETKSEEVETKSDAVEGAETTSDAAEEVETNAVEETETKTDADEETETKTDADEETETKTDADEETGTKTDAAEGAETKSDAVEETEQIATEASEASLLDVAGHANATGSDQVEGLESSEREEAEDTEKVSGLTEAELTEKSETSADSSNDEKSTSEEGKDTVEKTGTDAQEGLELEEGGTAAKVDSELQEESDTKVEAAAENEVSGSDAKEHEELDTNSSTAATAELEETSGMDANADAESEEGSGTEAKADAEVEEGTDAKVESSGLQESTVGSLQQQDFKQWEARLKQIENVILELKDSIDVASEGSSEANITTTAGAALLEAEASTTTTTVDL